MKISGKGFGSKSQAAPVLYDIVSEAFQNGVKSTPYASLPDGAVLQRPAAGDTSAVWQKPSVKVGDASAPLIVKGSRPTRHANVKAQYYVHGTNGFVGWPMAYGGSNTPVDNHELYVSWWLKHRFNFRFYWTLNLSSVSGKFTASTATRDGEEIVLGNGMKGRVIRHEGQTLTAVVYLAHNTNYLNSQTVRGLSSGAQAVIATSGHKSPGSNKIIRVWEDPNGKEGLRHAWSNLFWGTGVNMSKDLLPDMVEDEWNHMEFYVNTKEGYSWGKVNGEIVHIGSPTDVAKGKWSPTIALLGINGKEQYDQETDIGEIYMDSSSMRVVLSNASTWNDMRHSEIQFPTQWSDSSITVTLNLGSLDAKGPLYLYVVKGDKVFNQHGFKVR